MSVLSGVSSGVRLCSRDRVDARILFLGERFVRTFGIGQPDFPPIFPIENMSLIWDTGMRTRMTTWIPVRFYGPVRDVIHGWPLEVKKELGSVLTRLQKGEFIGMPDVRPMPDIGPQVSEIRIPDRSGSYRALYAIRMEFGILLFHAFQKKRRKTPEKEKRTARTRLEAFLKELEEEQ